MQIKIKIKYKHKLIAWLLVVAVKRFLFNALSPLIRLVQSQPKKCSRKQFWNIQIRCKNIQALRSMLATFQHMFGNEFWRNAILEVRCFTLIWITEHRHRQKVSSYHFFSLLWLFQLLWISPQNNFFTKNKLASSKMRKLKSLQAEKLTN